MTTKEQIEDIAIESSRDFDAWVAEHVFGWKEMKVPADANGENACVILAPPEGVNKDYTFPPKGTLHRGFLAPKFSSDTRDAMDFANEVGIRHIPLTAAHNPLAICRMAMRVFRAPETPKEQIEVATDIKNIVNSDIGLSGTNSARDKIAEILAKREAQAHAAGVREGLIKAAKIFDEKAELLSEDAEELGAVAAQEIRVLIKE